MLPIRAHSITPGLSRNPRQFRCGSWWAQCPSCLALAQTSYLASPSLQLNPCPALRPRWCPPRPLSREQDCCLPVDAHRRLWVRLPGLIPLSTIIHFSEFNDAACVLASPLLRTPPFSDRPSVRLPTGWLAFGRVGLEYSSHPLGNVDMFQEVSPLFSHPEFSSARAASCSASSMYPCCLA